MNLWKMNPCKQCGGEMKINIDPKINRKGMARIKHIGSTCSAADTYVRQRQDAAVLIDQWNDANPEEAVA